MREELIVVSKRFNTIFILILIVLMMIEVSNMKDEYANSDKTNLKYLHSSNTQANRSNSDIKNEAGNKNDLTTNTTSNTTASF